MIKYFDKEIHYDILCDWLEERGGVAPSIHIIPDFGFVDIDETIEDTRPLLCIRAMVLIYTTNSKVVITEFLVSNPRLSQGDNALAVKRIINQVYSYCDEKGLYAFNLSNDNKIRTVLEGFGTTFVSGGMDLMVYKGGMQCQH